MINRNYYIIFLALMFSQTVFARNTHLYTENRTQAGVVVEVYADGKDTYSTLVRKTGNPPLQLIKQKSLPPPRIYWVSPDLLRVDYGSGLGADIRSIFYSIKRNRADGPYDFVKVVDAETELILCAADSIYIQKLFAHDVGKFQVVLNDISTADLKWFVVGGETRFIKGKLFISYMNNHSDNGGDQEWKSREIEIPQSFLVN